MAARTWGGVYRKEIGQTIKKAVQTVHGDYGLGCIISSIKSQYIVDVHHRRARLDARLDASDAAVRGIIRHVSVGMPTPFGERAGSTHSLMRSLSIHQAYVIINHTYTRILPEAHAFYYCTKQAVCCAVLWYPARIL